MVYVRLSCDVDTPNMINTIFYTKLTGHEDRLNVPWVRSSKYRLKSITNVSRFKSATIGWIWTENASNSKEKGIGREDDRKKERLVSRGRLDLIRDTNFKSTWKLLTFANVLIGSEKSYSVNEAFLLPYMV